jgi:hypothetical protein
VPPYDRGRSRQDLPSLNTEVPGFRSSSAYAYTPAAKRPPQPPRPASGEFMLSPDVLPTARPPSRGYFDLSVTAAPRQSQAAASTPFAEKRKSGSRPTTPTQEKRHSGGPDLYAGLRKDLGEKLTKAQHLANEGVDRRSDRHSSTGGHLDIAAGSSHKPRHRRPSRRQYDSSEDDEISSDSDRWRRAQHGNGQRQGKVFAESDRQRHSGSGSQSNLSPTSSKPVSRPSSRLPSPLASPLASPNISPSQSPSADAMRAGNHGLGYGSGREHRRHSARPITPLYGPSQSVHPSNTLDPSSINGKHRARSRSRHRSRPSSPVRESTMGSLPIPIPARPDSTVPKDPRQSLGVHKHDGERRSASARPAEKPYWQPPPFQPPTEPNHLDKPVGSYRRYSQDVDAGVIAPLPPCPRTTPARGYNDWLTLPDCPVDSFRMCPSCFQGAIAHTAFRKHFVAARSRSSHQEVLCDFGSQPWYRIAWLLTRKEGRKDLKLISRLAEIADTIPPCLGKHEAVRHWYSIEDPKIGQPVRNFDVCYSCVKSIEAILPALKGIFVRVDHKGPPNLPRVCDMRFDSVRFVHYFDALETAADSADDGYPPDMSEFVELAKQNASVQECPRDENRSDASWHYIHELKQFTVCPECFEEVIRPHLARKRPIPAMFSRTPLRVPSASCQLYSPRMREIFERAVATNDYKLLATKARERRAKELHLKGELAQWKKKGRSGERQVREIEEEWKEVE